MPQYAFNRDARHNYQVLETIEAGIQLTGAEVKSIKGGNVSLKGSYATIKDSQLLLLNAHVGAYKPAGHAKHDPIRTRRLLVHKAELDKLIGTSKAAGITFVPMAIYSKNGLVKVELAIGRGKKSHDKRADIKKREVNRKIERAMRVKA